MVGCVIGIYIYAIVVLRDSTYFLCVIIYLKSSVTSTLVVNYSALNIFDHIAVVYRKIEESLIY